MSFYESFGDAAADQAAWCAGSPPGSCPGTMPPAVKAALPQIMASVSQALGMLSNPTTAPAAMVPIAQAVALADAATSNLPDALDANNKPSGSWRGTPNGSIYGDMRTHISLANDSSKAASDQQDYLTTAQGDLIQLLAASGGSSSKTLYLAIGAVVLVLAIGGFLMFSHKKSPSPSPALVAARRRRRR